MDVLEKIMTTRRQELLREKDSISLVQLQEKIEPRSKPHSLVRELSKPGLSLIAEIKKISPSKGLLCEDFDYQKIAAIYEKAGAAGISVLTEPNFFGGSLHILEGVRKVSTLPLLRKDFIFDEYQVYQASAFGADAILLIAAVLNPTEIDFLIDRARQLGLEVLLEATTREELITALESGADIIGINNRNLRNLKVDLNLTFKLMEEFSFDRPVVSESGIFTREDVIALAKAGVDGILVGTVLMQSENIERKIKELLGKMPDARCQMPEK